MFAHPKREHQHYGGPPPPRVGPSLMYVPRVVLFPVWLVSEYVLRQPVGALTRAAERNNWVDAVIQFFTFGPRQNIELYPSALFDFGLKPSVGFNLGWKYFLTDPNTLRVHFGTWGPDWIAVKASDEYALTPHQVIAAQASFVRRKDLPFYGIGPRSPSDPRYRYQAMTSEFALGYQNNFWRLSALTVRAGMRTLSFGNGGCCGEPHLSDAVANGTVPSPPGYHQGYIAEFQSLSVAIDTRRADPYIGTGLRLEAHGEGVVAPPHNDVARRAWVGYGGLAGVTIDLWKRRVLGLSVEADFTDPLKGTIPFTDQVSLGGERPMRGYLMGRLIDRSAAVATAQYVWPVWVYLNGVVQADVGNVFGPHLDGFSADLFRLSTAVGIRSNGSPDSGLELLVAGATDPFEQGFHYSSLRIIIGSHHGI